MTWKYFYELTEIYTTPLDVTWLILAASFSYYYYGSFNWLYAIFAFVIVIALHLFLNMQNNLEDYEHATDKTDYKHSTSTIGSNHLSLSMIKHWLLGFGAFIVIAGLILSYFTGWPTLVIGVIGFILGLAYSAGPKPLDATPLCELAVAALIPFFVPLIYMYMGSIHRWNFTLQSVLDAFLVTLLPFILFFIIQLANDTCDLEQDIGNNRHTLVDYIGKQNSIRVFDWIYWLSILVIPILSLVVGIVPYFALVTILIYPYVWSKVKVFNTNQDKEEIYNVIVMNISLIVMLYILTYMVGTVLTYLFK
ncbi:prenyltransferase [Fructilactobacillus fructivorans]|uniref:Prenyltransferase n=1 Tax=Fructilactobacillus fructivorans TaxID=1614 RepID=A0AAE6TVL3_9LACO|nr:prenyltransferase [Fructilactobacillus fructivorans]KRK58146.1 prenyltransferase [Fructilactobacillus fructivorans]KRN41378.1 prenyltransferase [Fructilactobacillus fructivorans]KRN42821.1 prenyltransferase [Fructilactobacillus fructivorans]QFX92144.1 prenyltransferase [Fructilactobacillus fructivorans]RDV65192.1 prenyltransferase [Fructilactobacillus fructivorans]